ncbi:MAG: hypothetical protein EXR94_13385 [Gemmatimonadetes bacterium]|nr:hypothetical protein [Gemmatimonadota bacterium]
MTFVANLLLLVAAFLGAQLAVAWGELGSYPLHGDKSGMAGFGAIIILMPMRWLAVAVALAIGVGRRAQVMMVLALHLALGVAAYRVFEWIAAAIQRDLGGPQKVAIGFGVVVPVAVWLTAFWAVNRQWLGRRPVVTALVVVAVLAGHLAGWRSGSIR